MSLTHALHFLAISKNHPSSLQFPSSYPTFFTSPKLLNSRSHLPNPRFSFSQTRLLAAAKFDSSFQEPHGVSHGSSGTSFDAFLSAFEFLSLVSSAAVSVYFLVRCEMQRSGALGLFESKILVWQCVVLVGGLIAGALIRRRQWKRIFGVRHLRWPASTGANLLERVEKLEDDLGSSTTIIQALARRLEKLGIRFRITRKALKEPMAETAALVQKNAEATQVLAVQEDVLEKELGEVHKVLLAMQEQQQKQLELILAIGKAGNILESKHGKGHDQKTSGTSKPPVDGFTHQEINQVRDPVLHKEANIE